MSDTLSPSADPFGEDAVEVPRGGPVAGGRRTAIPAAPPLPAWPDPASQDAGDAVDGQIDYSDLHAVNKDLLALRVRLSRVRRGQRAAERDAVEAKVRYQRAYRRSLIQQSGGSAESRKAAAELLCEELEADLVMKQQVADEFSTLFRSVRDDLENAKAVAFNLRSLMNLM